MSITATELKNNLGKYLLLSAKEDVFITKNGKYNKWYIANGHTPVYIKKNQREKCWTANRLRT